MASFAVDSRVGAYADSVFHAVKEVQTDEKPHYFNGVAYVRNGSCHFRAFGYQI